MPCVDVPSPPVPSLPFPLSVPPLPPPPPVQAGLCCQSVELAVVTPPLPIGPLDPAVLTALRAALHAFQAYVDDLIPPCPRNS